MKQLGFLKEQRGQAVAEMACVLPVLLFIVMGVLTLGLMIYAKTLVVISASQAAKVGAYLYYDETLSDEEIEDAIRSTANTLLSNGMNGTDRSVAIDSDGVYITVTVEYDYSMILPLLGKVLENKTSVVNGKLVVPLRYSCTYLIQ